MTFEETKTYIQKRCANWSSSDIGDGLYIPGWHMSWFPHSSIATLDGQFTADDLIAIGTYMKGVTMKCCKECPDDDTCENHKVCMCGSMMEDHDIGTGHSPVSMHDYYRAEQPGNRFGSPPIDDLPGESGQ